MPYRSSTAATRGRTAGTRRGAAPRARRRTSIATSARYNRSAGAQSMQIRRLARIAVRNSQILQSQRLYTDYYINGGTDATFTTNYWQVYSIIDPVSWLPTLRRNTDADNAQNAFIRSMHFQYTASLYKLQNPAVMSLFLVSIRPNAANFTPVSGGLTDGEDFQNLGFYSMPILNSGLVKVKWSKTFVLQSNNLEGPSIVPTQDVAIGDASDSYIRGSVNLAIAQTYRSPSRFIAPAVEPGSWSTLSDENLRPMQRLYFLAFYQSSDTVNAAGLTWSAKFNVVTTN